MVLNQVLFFLSFSPNSRSTMVLQTRTQESQMKTLAGPAIIFFTSCCGLPQKEQKLILEGLAMDQSISSVFGRLLHQPNRIP